MAVIVVLAAAVLIVLFGGVFVVTMQIHREERRFREGRRAWEERRQWNRSLHREEIPIPLTLPARGGWEQFARSVCGVYISGIGGEPAAQPQPQPQPRPLPEQIPAWYERTSGPTRNSRRPATSPARH
jgi:type II secretory pathway pseudopilin PulG